MIQARFVTIEAWPVKPTPHSARKNAPFSGSWANTLDSLEREITHLRGRDIVVQAFFRQQDIRNDGWPRSSAPNPSGPGVIVSFDSPGGGLSFPCDTFCDWRHNLRAIALSLSALRAVERYGVTRQQEQYKGWRRLEAPPLSTETRAAAIAFITKLTGMSLQSIEADPVAAYRRAASVAHPDQGGSHDLFTELQKHMEALR